MKRFMIGLAMLAVPLALQSCKRPEEKRAEVAREAQEEQREYQKDITSAQREANKEILEAQREADKKITEARQDESKEIAEANEEHREDMGDLTRDAFVTSANTELDRLDRNIESLETRANTMTGEAKAKINADIESLKHKYDALKKDLDDAKDKTDAEFSQVRKNFETSMRNLDREINDLTNRAG